MTFIYDRIDCLILEFLESSIAHDEFRLNSIMIQIDKLETSELNHFLSGIAGAIYGVAIKK